MQDGLLRLHRILEAVRVEVRDTQLRADAAHFLVGLLHLGPLFGNLVLEGCQRAGDDLLLLFDPLALVFLRDAVGQIGRLLGISALDTDLEKVCVAHLAHVDHAAQLEVGLLGRADTELLAPPLNQLQGFDHRVKHLLALNDLELGGGKPGVHSHCPLVAFGEDADLLLVLLDLDDDVRLVLTWQKVGRHARGDHDKEEGQNNDRQAQPDHAPIIEEVQLRFLHSVCVAIGHIFFKCLF